MQATRNWMALWHFPFSPESAFILRSCPGLNAVSICLQGEDYPGWKQLCVYQLSEMQASASGTLNECMSNPWYQPVPTQRKPSSQGSTVSDGPIVIGRPRDDYVEA